MLSPVRGPRIVATALAAGSVLVAGASSAAVPQPTQCNGTAKIGSAAARGCLRHDWRLGPRILPWTTGTVGKLVGRYRRFGSLGRAGFLKRYWQGSASKGSWRYPKRNGFAGPTVQVQLAAGTLVDRFGSPFGTFLAPAGTSYGMRSIPPSNLDTYPGQAAYNYHVYRVTGTFTVLAGAVAPWFGQRGGGVQFQTCFGAIPCTGAAVNVNYLIAHDDLVEVSSSSFSGL
jgi:hypothetical protein